MGADLERAAERHTTAEQDPAASDPSGGRLARSDQIETRTTPTATWPETSAFEPATGPPPSLEPSEWLATICPYLRAADGTWRATRPHRDHRCWAQDPPASLAALTQARLCLTPAHESCDFFRAAEARRAQFLAADHVSIDRLSTARFGTRVRSIPLTLDPTTDGPESDRRSRRNTALAGVVGIGAAALLLLIVFSGVLGPAARPSPTPLTGVGSPTPQASMGAATAAPTVLPSASTAAPSPTVAPTATPAAPTPTPPIARTYRVRSGDTLRTIAKHFGVTVAQIRAVNDLGDPPTITPGQIINIPFPA